MLESKRLLIVEDERIVALDLRRRLEKLGHVVVDHVVSGDAAISSAAEHHPDLILMDIRIEGPIDGIDTAAKIRQKLHIPHIFLTAHSDEATIERAKKTDPDGYILKPFTDRDISLNIQIADQKAIFRNELRLSELKFRSLVQNSSDIIIEVNQGGQILYASPPLERILGYNPDLLVGTSLAGIVEKQDVSGLNKLFEQCGFIPVFDTEDVYFDDIKTMVSGGQIPKSELRFTHAEKGWLYMEVLASKTQNDEMPVTLVLNVRDISERKRFETELMQAKIKAEEMNRLKSVFLSNISHELRTPLTGILGFASILETELDGEQLDMAQSITKSGNRLLETMESVMDLALMESNKIDVEFSDVVVSDVVQQIVRMLTGVAFEKNLRIKVIARNEPKSVETDRRLLAQVLHNIVSNAIKFTEKGGVQITIDQTVEQYGGDRHSFVLIHIKDTGIGINEDFIPYIFDEFKQESTGNTRKYEGTGLGLSIAKRMITLLNGDITVQSKPGHGTTFTIKLPF
ncbi:MAG TPA: hypothetical protein DCE78_09660 [Bacteroidetes bacterium]|nr:hypothetical protein [Bacteroidota bacterium]